MLGFRTNSTDWIPGGSALDDAVTFARFLKAEGIDYAVISTGNLAAGAKIPPATPGHQVAFAEGAADISTSFTPLPTKWTTGVRFLCKARFQKNTKAPTGERAFAAERGPRLRSLCLRRFKATSLASTLTLMEVTNLAQKIIAETFRAIEVFLVASAVYLTINFHVSRMIRVGKRWIAPNPFAATRNQSSSAQEMQGFGHRMRLNRTMSERKCFWLHP